MDDILNWPGVDVVLDVRQPRPFGDVEFVFAEHFLEHLTLADGLVRNLAPKRYIWKARALRF